jgi:hypothetical protein
MLKKRVDKLIDQAFSLLDRQRSISDHWQPYVYLLIVMSVILFFRRPDALLHPQPFAEDGTIFIQGIINQSYHSFFVLYAGYLHLIPRLVTYFAMQFGLVNAPLLMNASSLIIAVFCSSYFFRKDFRFIIKNDLVRFLMCILIICIPVNFWLNITNIQWVLSIYLTLWTLNILFNYDAAVSVRLSVILDAIIATLAFLTCSFSIILLPFLLLFFIKRILDKKLFTAFTTLQLLPLLALILQLIACYTSKKTGSISINIMGIIYCFSLQALSCLYLPGKNTWIKPAFLAIIMMLLILSIVVINFYKRKDKSLDISILILILLYYVVVLVGRPDYVQSVQVLNDVYRLGDRFAFYPIALMLILIVRNIEYNRQTPGKDKKTGLKLANYAQVIMLLIFLVNAIIGYYIPPLQDMNFGSYAKYYDPGGNYTYTIPINPPGWNFTAPTNSNISVIAKISDQSIINT